MGHFCLVPNGMGFHTTRYPAYMVWIPDTWSICEGPVLHRLHGELPEAGALHGGVVVPVG